MSYSGGGNRGLVMDKTQYPKPCPQSPITCFLQPGIISESSHYVPLPSDYGSIHGSGNLQPLMPCTHLYVLSLTSAPELRHIIYVSLHMSETRGLCLVLTFAFNELLNVYSLYRGDCQMIWEDLNCL